MKNILAILRNVLGDIRNDVLKYLVGITPKKKNLILFSAWFGEKYTDSSMYQFEYMLKNTDYRLYWFTKNESLYRELEQKGIPVLYSKTLKAKWYQTRAAMLVSSVQTNDYHPLFLNKCLFLDLDHGFPGKPVGLAQPTVTKQWADQYHKCMNGLSFYQTASSRFVADMQCKCYDLKLSHQIFANKPRIDVLFDKELQKGKNIIVDKIKKGRKAFVYLPTHRSCGKVGISLKDVLDLDAIQKICEESNSVFIIKKHFYHRNEIENLDKYDNIYDITHDDIDTQVLLAQTDTLITDFSSCFIDYLALNKPIIFYAYDYDEYLKKERDFYWKYNAIEAGFTIKTKDEFDKTLKIIANDWIDSLHVEGRRKMRRFYFDDEVEMGSSRKKIRMVIDDLLAGTYKAYDWDKKEECIRK